MNLYLVDKGLKRVAVRNFYRVPCRVAALELVAIKSDGGPAFELECSAARLMIVQGDLQSATGNAHGHQDVEPHAWASANDWRRRTPGKQPHQEKEIRSFCMHGFSTCASWPEHSYD
jgi:hypothetical protein